MQVLNLPLPPPSSDKASLDGDYYCKAIAKVLKALLRLY
jgi:hypothetical protein